MYNKNCDKACTDLKLRKGGGNFMHQTSPLSQVYENQCIGLIGEYCETIFSLEYRTMDKLQERSNCEDT
jgi:hypothetical protein